MAKISIIDLKAIYQILHINASYLPLNKQFYSLWQSCFYQLKQNPINYLQTKQIKISYFGQLSEIVYYYIKPVDNKVQRQMFPDKLKHFLENKGYTAQQFTLHRQQSLTNIVYKVFSQKTGKSYIYKQYRSLLDDFINRGIERRLIQQLSNNNDYPQIYENQLNYRIEEFIGGQILCNQNCNQEILTKVIEKLAYFAQKYTPHYHNYEKIRTRQLPNLFKTFQKIYDKMKVEEKSLTDKCSKEIQTILNPQLRENLIKLMPKTMIMSHNDSNLSNILFSQNQETKTTTLHLLDYQFSCMNYVGFDIGNFFNQYATQYDENFQIKPEWQIPSQLSRILIEKYFKILEKNLQISPSKEQMFRIVDIGRMLSHIFWMFVGLQQIGDKQIKLDMVYYVRRRYEQFQKYYNKITQNQR